MGQVDKFKETFFLECDELIARVELYLGALTGAPADTEQLQSAFRAIHSIKGGAGMFGFQRLVAFAHVFESAIDTLWRGRAAADAERVTRLVQATDVLSDLVGEVRAGTMVANDIVSDATEHLEAIVAAGGEAAKAPTAKRRPTVSELAPVPAVYDILFEPSSDMFRRAIEPLGIVRRLRDLGQLAITADAARLPEFAALDPAAAYVSWRMRLVTSAPKEAIARIFEFAAGSCRLEIAAVAAAPSATPLPRAAAIGPKAAPDGSEPEADGDVDATPASVDRRSFVARDRTPMPQVERRVSSIRVDLDRVDRLVNLVGEIAIAQAMLLQQLDHAVVDANPQLMRVLSQLEQHTRTLQDSVMGIRAQPVRTIFGRMPRVVRELARQLGKSVDLVLSGEETEIDKTIIEELSEPLIHLLRNAVDHGIEPAAERRARGKPEHGTIRLSAARQGSRIAIQVSDDGRGIDRSKVRRRAIERGLIESEARLSDEEIESLTFAPGLTTTDEVSKISGRGVGMDIVAANIERIGGRVTISSKPGAGTTAILILPLTLAVLDGMVVRAGYDRYVIPLANAVECAVLPLSAIRSLPGTGAVANVRGRQMPVVSLAGTLGSRPTAGRNSLELIVVDSDVGPVAIGVDEIVGQQQVVVKSVRENYCDLPGIAGATLLGDGTLALILDVAETLALPGARASACDLVPSTGLSGDQAA